MKLTGLISQYLFIFWSWSIPFKCWNWYCFV